MTNTADYTIRLADSLGRTVDLHISGAAVDAMEGDEEAVETNAGNNAIAEGLIGHDAWVVYRSN